MASYATADVLRNNLSLLSPQQVELANMLIEMEQSHLFEQWPEPGVDDNEKHAFFDRIDKLNSSYPGGLKSYIITARELLADSMAGKNPFDGFTPSVPSGEVLAFGDDNFVNYEEAGIREARKAAFVLVAGGLGERLGYNGIKVAFPSESITGTCFLQNYIESILALQDASCRAVQDECQAEIPLVIMTSDDTHSRTLELLECNAYFGMKPTQVKLLKQEKVACLIDNEAHLALEPNNKYRIQTKPHGHGDVHSLLYSSGVLKEWHNAGLRWVLFFQDTNGLLFKGIPASLGVSATKQYHVNSLAVPRKAKEAIGGITKLTHKDGRTMVINVEYNQLDPLLRATGYPDGDVNSESGYSPFPGNINQLILELGPYMEELTRTGGAIKEFVNPKYKDSTKTAFKSSTRLECMMQDYPRTLPPSARVGFTVMDTWLAYAPVKNNPEDAAKGKPWWNPPALFSGCFPLTTGKIMDSLEPNSEEDIFHSAVCVEQDHYKEGYNQGYADGLASVNDEEDGWQVGLRNGFEVGEEVGFYRGVIDVWNSAIMVDPNCFSSRIIKSIKQMEDLLHKYPITRPEDESVTDLKDSLRLKFRAICASLHLKLEYNGYPKASSDEGKIDF